MLSIKVIAFFFSTTQLFFLSIAFPLFYIYFLPPRLLQHPLLFYFYFYIQSLIVSGTFVSFFFLSVCIHKINFRQECCFLLLRRIDQQKKKIGQHLFLLLLRNYLPLYKKHVSIKKSKSYL